MNLSNRLISAALLTACLNIGWAQAAPADAKSTQRITAALNASFAGDGITVQSVEKIQFFEDLFEVVVLHDNQRKILYTNGSGSHLILGDLHDTKTMTNMTQAKSERLNAINFDKDLPLGLALKSVYGNGSRKIAVFEDPNCGYCKRFRRDALSKLQDTTVYTFVLPILGPSSTDISRKVLCSSDKVKTWDNWMLKNESPSGDGNCKAPIEELVALGRGLKVTGTPTIFFQDGSRVSGAITANDLNRRISTAAR